MYSMKSKLCGLMLEQTALSINLFMLCLDFLSTSFTIIASHFVQHKYKSPSPNRVSLSLKLSQPYMRRPIVSIQS